MGTNKECRKIKELIMEAVDGLPEKNLENKVNNHVSGCADCAKYREELLKIKSALADFPYKQPAYLEAKILNGVINDEMAEKPVGRSIFKAPVFAYGALFAVLVIASFFYIYNSAGIGEITEQPVIAAGGPETEAAAATEAAAKAPEKEMIEIAVTEPGIRIVEAEKTAPVRASSAPVFNNERTIITAQEPAGRQAAPHRVAEVPYTSAGVAAAKMTPVEVPGGNELLDADGAIVANNMVNPLNGDYATIMIKLDEPSNVRVIVYDKRLKEVNRILDEKKDRGVYEARWYGKNDYGEALSDGVYFVYIQIGTRTVKKNMIVSRSR